MTSWKSFEWRTPASATGQPQPTTARPYVISSSKAKGMPGGSGSRSGPGRVGCCGRIQEAGILVEAEVSASKSPAFRLSPRGSG